MPWASLTPGIYKITLLKDGRSYIGSSVGVERRWTDHKRDLKGNYHHSRHLQRAWNKYGADAFGFEILEKCDVEGLDDDAIKELLFQREQFWFDSIRPEFNGCLVARSRLGYKATPETRAKQSAARKGKVAYFPTPETRAKISASHMGKPATPGMSGKKHSQETKDKIAVAVSAAAERKRAERAAAQ